MLTDALDVAAADVIGLGTTAMADVFLDLRRALLKDGREFLVLFEDIAIARGLEQDLFDALATPAVRAGRRQLCNLRVALAVTNEHWDERVPETLATRLVARGNSMYSLDLRVEDAVERAPDLVGRYLNAARIGRSAIDALSLNDLAHGVPNACEQCPFDRKDECHSTFGVTPSGHGLFPIVECGGAHPRQTGRRAPPGLGPSLSSVVAPTIADARAVNEGSFPSPGALRDIVDGGIERHALPEIGIDRLRNSRRAA